MAPFLLPTTADAQPSISDPQMRPVRFLGFLHKTAQRDGWRSEKRLAYAMVGRETGAFDCKRQHRRGRYRTLDIDGYGGSLYGPCPSKRQDITFKVFIPPFYFDYVAVAVISSPIAALSVSAP